MQGVRSLLKERTPCMQDVRSCIVASYNGYPVKDAVIKASPPVYSGEDDTTAGVNTSILVLTPCIKNFDVVYTTLKSCNKNRFNRNRGV